MREGLPCVVMGSGCWLRWGHSWDFSISACMRIQPLGGGFEVSGCLLTLPNPSRREPCRPRRSHSTRMGTGALLTAASPRKSCSRSCKRGTSSRPTCSWCRRSWPITRSESWHGGIGTVTKVPPVPAATPGPSEAAPSTARAESSPGSRLTSCLLFTRELLNEERIPSFFLDAMKSNIKKQRKKIRAKMLGTTEESASR